MRASIVGLPLPSHIGLLWRLSRLSRPNNGVSSNLSERKWSKTTWISTLVYNMYRQTRPMRFTEKDNFSVLKIIAPC